MVEYLPRSRYSIHAQQSLPAPSSYQSAPSLSARDARLELPLAFAASGAFHEMIDFGFGNVVQRSELMLVVRAAARQGNRDILKP